MKCYWFNRWYHRRLRRIDETILFPAIKERARMKAGKLYSIYTEAFDEKTKEYYETIIELHKTLPGQEYWHCDCSKETK